jgi:hypothetical protein
MGRKLFLAAKFEQALLRFDKVTRTDPDYVFEGSLFREGIWTYIGRAQYSLAKLADARYSFERALSKHKEDPLATLFLGLTFARAGDNAIALRSIEAGMKSLHSWLEEINSTRPFEAFWDPQHEIREAIETDLTTISSRHIDWQQLIANAEWLGQRMEEEIDHVRRHARQTGE